MTTAAQPVLDFWKDIAIILGGVVALVTFYFGYLEFNRQGRQHNAASFVQMRRRFLESPTYTTILNLLATDDPSLRDVPIQDRRNLVGFFEEIALMVNSGMTKPEVAHYMYGYYVLLTERSENLWWDLDRNSIYWTVFREFARLMHEYESAPATSRRELRF